MRGRWRSAFDQEGNVRRELGRVGHRRRVGNKREREQGTPFLGQCTPASLTAPGEPQKDRWILGDFDAMGSAAPPCLSHLPPPSCRPATPDRSHGKLGRTLTLWSKPSLSGPAAWLEGVNCGAPWGRAWMLLCLREELPPPEDRSQGTISLLHLQPLPQVAHPLLPLISGGAVWFPLSAAGRRGLRG